MNATSNEAVERDVMEYDFLIVGAGPAGLACAIRLKQLKPDLNICVLEKGATVGAHSLSGAVMEPGPLDQLAPEWRDAKLGVCVPVVHDELRILTRKGTHRLPVPPQQRNHGNFIVSLGLLTAWLAQKAEGLGVDVFAGFAAAAPLFDEAGAVAGVCISDMGLEKNGEPGPNYAPGPEIRARATILAEGCRGSLTKQLIKRFKLDAESDPQTYGLGFKELWQLPAGRGTPGLIQHSVGWPLDNQTYGGSFIYHLDADRVYVGFVVGLDYIDPMLKPFEVFQQFKHHPSVKPLFEGGKYSLQERAPLPRAAGSRCPNSKCPVQWSSAMRVARSISRRSRAFTRRFARVRSPRNISPQPARRRGSTRCGVPRRAGRSCARCATSSRASSAACGSALQIPRLKSRWVAARPGHCTTRTMLRPCAGSMSTPHLIAAGSIAACRRATGSHPCSSRPPRTTKRSRCT